MEFFDHDYFCRIWIHVKYAPNLLLHRPINDRCIFCIVSKKILTGSITTLSNYILK